MIISNNKNLIDNWNFRNSINWCDVCVVNTGAPIWSFIGHDGDIYSVSVESDGNVYSDSANSVARKNNASSIII